VVVCSYSSGKGLNPDEKSYGVILSEMLNMPLKLVAWPGTSTNFSLRHIVNADIRENDIVIWQITTAERFSYKEDGRLFEFILPHNPEPRFMDFFTDEQLNFQQMVLLNMGCMYLRAKKVQFVVTSIVSDTTPVEPLIQEYTRYPEFCPTFDCNLDKGNDNSHVGPLSHQKTALTIFNHMHPLIV